MTAKTRTTIANLLEQSSPDAANCVHQVQRLLGHVGCHDDAEQGKRQS